MRFERAISIRLYNLITLQFVLRFPIDMDLHNNKSDCSREYAVLQNDLWQSRGWFVRDYIDIGNKLFIIYTTPYALSDDRFLRNYTFIAAQQPDLVNLKTHRLLSWTCTHSDPSAIAQSLNGLSQARHLYWDTNNVSLYSFFFFFIKVDRSKMTNIERSFFELSVTVYVIFENCRYLHCCRYHQIISILSHDGLQCNFVHYGFS
jgi:hypothetical protein